MNLESRINKIEQTLTDMEASNVNLELFDINGQKVDAKILRMPQTWETGVAILPDGREKEISCVGNWGEIILGTEKVANEKENDKTFENESEHNDYSDMLFLRRDGRRSAVEELYQFKK